MDWLIDLSICLSTYLSIYLPIHLPIYLVITHPIKPCVLSQLAYYKRVHLRNLNSQVDVATFLHFFGPHIHPRPVMARLSRGWGLGPMRWWQSDTNPPLFRWDVACEPFHLTFKLWMTIQMPKIAKAPDTALSQVWRHCQAACALEVKVGILDREHTAIHSQPFLRWAGGEKIHRNDPVTSQSASSSPSPIYITGTLQVATPEQSEPKNQIANLDMSIFAATTGRM